MRWFSTGRGVPPLIDADTLHAWACDEAVANADLQDLIGTQTLTNKTGSPAYGLGPVGNYRRCAGSQGWWGSSAGADIAEIAGDTYTVHALVRVDAEGCIVEYGASGDYVALRMRVDSDGYVVWEHTGSFGTETLTSTYLCAWSEWVLLSLVVNATDPSVSVYSNGELHELLTGSDPGEAGASGQLWHVGLQNGGSNKFTGRIGYIWVQAGAETADQIAETARRARRAGWLSNNSAKVTLYDSDDNEREMSSQSGTEWVSSIEITDSSDQRIQMAAIEFVRDQFSLSLSKWHDNKMNRAPFENPALPGPDDTTYGNPDAATSTELLEIKRRVVIMHSLVPMGVEPSATDWSVIFDGLIDAVDWGQDPVQVRCSDHGVVIKDATIEDPLDVTGGSIEGMIQDMLDAGDAGVWYAGTAPTVWVPVASGLSYDDVREDRRPLLEVCSGYADEVGWVLRYRWRESTGQHELKFYEPERTKSRADMAVCSDDGLSIGKMAVDIANIRTVCRVVYPSATKTDESGNPVDVEIKQEADGSDIPIDSISKYGRIFCEISAGSSRHISSSAQGAKLARAVLYDLCQPTVEASAEFDQAQADIEIEDGMRLIADGSTTTADITCAVFAIRHRWDGLGSSTSAEARGRPSGGSQIHFSRETRGTGNASAPTSRSDLGVPRRGRDWSMVRHGIISRSPMGGRSRRGYVANPAFEMWSWPDEAPDGWNVTTGTWGSSGNVHYDTSEVKSAARAVMFRDGNGDLSSNLFAVEELEILGLRIKQKRQAATGSTLVVYVDTYTADRTTSAGSVTAITTTDSASWLTEQGFAGIPSGARFARVRLAASSATTRKIYVDSVECFHQGLWCKGYRTSNQTSITTGALRQILLDVEKDPAGVFASYAFTADRAGRYDLAMHIEVTCTSAATAYATLKKNGNVWKNSDIKTLVASPAGSPYFGGSGYEAWFDIVLNGIELAVGDAITLWAETTATLTAIGTEDTCYLRAKLNEET